MGRTTYAAHARRARDGRLLVGVSGPYGGEPMRKPHRLPGLSVGLVLVLGVLAACAPPPPSPSAQSAPNAPAAQSAPAGQSAPAANAALPAPTQAPTARSAGTPGGTLRIGGETPLDDLDPHTVR